MVREAEQSGVLRPGATIVESSSGNTGIGLALIGALTGHPVIVLAADTTSEVKLAVLRSFNAEVLLTDWTAQRNLRKTPAMLQPGSPPKYPAPGDHSSIGTGGTKVIGADPVGSAYSGGEPGEIIVDGVGNTWDRADWPTTFNPHIVDEFIRIPNVLAYSTVHRLATEEGLILGPSSGLAVAAALQTALSAPAGSTIVAIAPDAGTNYLSKAPLRVCGLVHCAKLQ